MATGFHIRVDPKDVYNAIAQVRKEDAPFITAYALTMTGQDIKEGENALMFQVFDRPTPFTMNALQLKPATKTDLVAIVDFKSGFGSIPAWRYLGPQVQGGGRAKKSHERALERAGILKADEYVMPGKGVTLDAYGNMKGSDISRILSQLRASPDPMQNATGSRRSKGKRQRVGTYFVSRGKRIKDGVYLRKGNGIVPVMVFTRAPKYSPRYPFNETAQKIFNQRFMVNARAAFEKTMARFKRAA